MERRYWYSRPMSETNEWHYRRAVPEDAERCVDIRGRTRENAFSADQLRELGITPGTWAEGIRDGSFPGHVCSVGGTMVGYCFGDRDSGEIVVLALLPEYENRGIGKSLLQRVIDDFRTAGRQRLFLGCSADPAARSHGFYRHLGWKPTGERDGLGDEVLELLLPPTAAGPR